VVDALLFMGMFNFVPDSRPHITSVVIGVTLAFGLVGWTIFSFVDKRYRSFGGWAYLNKKYIPDGFDPKYIEHPYYQEALEEYWNGKDIGTLRELSYELSQLEEYKEEPKESKITSELAQSLRDARELRREAERK